MKLERTIEILKEFLKDYSDEEKVVLGNAFCSADPSMPKKTFRLMEEVTKLEAKGIGDNPELLMLRARLLKELAYLIREESDINGRNMEVPFLLLTHGFPKKRRELMERMAPLDETKSAVMEGIVSLIRDGYVSPENIFLDTDDKKTTMLNAQLANGEWLLALHGNELDKSKPYGQCWFTYYSKDRVDASKARAEQRDHRSDASLFDDAYRYAYHEMYYDKEGHSVSQINHDNASLDLGSSIAQGVFIRQHGKYYDWARKIDKQVEDIENPGALDI
jgi:hypothetical protein